MARLTISLLGSLDIRLDDQPVTHLVTGKARALLSYLAIEAARPHRRETLAGLLWPDYEERSARANLRNTLSNLRKVLGDRDATPPFLLITRETVQFNRASDCWIDVAAFGVWVAESAPAEHHLEEAIDLYRGPFLEGFSGGDSPAFDDWTFGIRERLAHQFSAALQALAEQYEGRGEYARACAVARRRVAPAPWQEQAHRDLMRLLALSGQRGAALAQYEACRRALREELNVEPGGETRCLYERIRDGKLAPPAPPLSPPTGGKDVGGISVPREAKEHPMPPVAQQNVPTPHAQRSSPPPGGLEGERRVITALFADVEGSTALAGQIDTEDWAEIMSHALQILSAEVHRYGGQVDRYEGDGLVAFFGLSTAHEDDAERAVLAALAMQEAIKRYAAELAQRQGAPAELLLRVGLSTGEVITTRVGEARQHGEATAMGRTIALASRLEPTAEPGTVLVSEDTYRLVERSFEWQSMGSIVAKGYSEPVAAYRPLKHRAISGKGRGIEGLESPLIGRDTEFRALQEAIERLRVGIGGIVTVVGEAGIGKSRLVTEVRKWANQQIADQQNANRGPVICASNPEPPNHLTTQPPSPQWIEGHCLSYGGSIAYLPWLGILRGILRVAPDALPAAVGNALRARVQALCPDCFDAVYPYLCRLMSLPLGDEYEAIRNVQGEGLRAELFWAVQTLIERAAAQRPLVMICEDLHWADAASLALLDQVLALTDRAALPLICVFRPQVEHGCWRLKETAARLYRHRHTDLWLDALSADESRTLVGHLLRVEALPAALQGKILDRAEGNPFYVEEIIRTLIDDGAIAYDEARGHWGTTRQIAEIPIPETLHGVLMGRIDRLEEETRRVLRLASVIGRVFPYRVLAEIVPSPATRPEPPTAPAPSRAEGKQVALPVPAKNKPGSPLRSEGEKSGTLDARLLTLQRQQLIRERARVPELEYIFKHELTREAAYNGLLKRERRAYHRQAAEALERLFPAQVHEQADLLAHHWEQAGKAEKAIHYLHQAGDKAVQLYAYQEGRAHLTRALSLLMAQPDSPERAEQELALQLSLALAWMVGESAVAEGIKAYTRARALCQDTGNTSELSRIVGILANCHYVGAEYQRARELAEEALNLAQQAGDPIPVAACHWRLGFILFALGEYAAARPHLEQMIAFYEPRHHQALIFLGWSDPGPSALGYDACCLWCLGYPEQALKRSQEALSLARALDHPVSLVEILGFLGGMLNKMHRDALTLKRDAEEAMQVAHEKGLHGFLALATCNQGAALAMLGQFQEGIAQLSDGTAACQSTGACVLLSEHLCSLAEAQAKAGHPEDGLATLARAFALVEDTGERYWEAELYRLRAELLLMQDDQAGAEASLQEAIEVARWQQAKSWELRATTRLAHLWREQDRKDEARQILAEIYGWFTEGFDSPDLREARTSLEELSS